MEDLRECYRFLEVEPGASLDEVKRSYRELVKVWHPDRFSHDPKLRDKAVEKLKQINLSFERIVAAGETYRYSEASAKEEKREQRQYGRPDSEDFPHPRREPPPGAPADPAPPQPEAWLHRFAPALAGVGAAVIVAALIMYLTPEPEPRFLIDLPPDSERAAVAPQEQPQPKDQQPATGSARPRRRLVVPTFALPQEKLFGKGSTVEEVIAAQGRPDSATEKLFRYGTSDVHFENGKVVSWRNGYPRLKVRMVAAPNLGGRNFFTVGSTKDQVIDAQGTPDSFTETSFTYGTSKVYFVDGRVKSWRIHKQPLNAKLLPKSDIGSPSNFTVGSSKDEVLAAQGTPDAFTDSEFHYGTSRVFFDNDRVTSWDSRHPTLRVRP
jgi:hypothetical protein